ncbi:hypothetical protein G7046_g5798 [Stylonectria norvegica]|nr:hypothetical protein G7046_g5798 [Stylonectria norvegica]
MEKKHATTKGVPEPWLDSTPEKTLQEIVQRFRADCTYSFNIDDEYDTCNEDTQRQLFRQMWYTYKRSILLPEPAADAVVLGGNVDVRTRDPRYDGNNSGFGKYDDKGKGYDDAESSNTTPEDQSSNKAGQSNKSRLVVDAKTGEIDIFADAYMVKGHFQRDWVPALDDKLEQVEKIIFRMQCASQLYKEPNSQGYTFAAKGTNTPYEQWVYPSSLISSQLLLYRLIAVFGMPPRRELDRYKQIWEYTLLWKPDEDNKSAIKFYDYKGTCSLSFRGSEEASKSALKLFEWLVSDNVPHTYDYTLAGTAA